MSERLGTWKKVSIGLLSALGLFACAEGDTGYTLQQKDNGAYRYHHPGTVFDFDCVGENLTISFRLGEYEGLTRQLADPNRVCVDGSINPAEAKQVVDQVFDAY